MVKCEKCGKNFRTLKGHKCEENGEFALRRHEMFLHQRLQQYVHTDVNSLDDQSISSLMKAFRIFVEQNVRRIAYRQKWTWANPQVSVKRKKVKTNGNKNSNLGPRSK